MSRKLKLTNYLDLSKRFKTSVNNLPFHSLVNVDTKINTIVLNKLDQYVLKPMYWGFYVEWCDVPIANTRVESISTKRFVAEHYVNQRCLISVETFYERQLKKNVHFNKVDKEPMLLAGIWRKVNRDTYEFLLVTRVSSINKKFREPFIINNDLINEWLNPKYSDPIQQFSELNVPFEDNQLTLPI